jgi:hypothetical protein
MAVLIHHAPQFKKCLEKLRCAGGRAALAAAQVEGILATLTLHERIPPEQVHKRTTHGERRIDGCQKFDLVGGYRLAYVKEGHQYCLLFAGTHDACDRWLNHHKRLKPVERQDNRLYIMPQMAEVPPASPRRGPGGDWDWDYDEILLPQIDEKMLRRIFRGLYGA